MRLAFILFALIISATPAWAAKTILIMGDSLSAGYGIRPVLAWPSLLDKRLADKHLDYSVANLSISGETTAGGLSRIRPALREHQPSIVIIALGANDGLRGLPLSQMRSNLTAMIEASQAANARVLVIGMRLPPNYGPYADEFHTSFATVARAHKTARLDFLLETVAGQPNAFQPDNLHPTAEMQPLILNHVWTALLPLLK